MGQSVETKIFIKLEIAICFDSEYNHTNSLQIPKRTIMSSAPENAPAEITEVEITQEPVELYKILKFESMVTSGGEAKMVITQGMVMVNGEIETQKRKKIVSGDIIEFNGEKLLIKLQS